MKKLIYIFTAIALIFTACKKDEDPSVVTSTGSVSGLKSGTFTVNGSKVEPNKIFFSGGNLEARVSGSATLNDLIIEIGNNFESKTYPLSSNTITASTLRIEYQTGTTTSPIIWYSKGGSVLITGNTNSVTADFKDVVFAQVADASNTVKISGYLIATI